MPDGARERGRGHRRRTAGSGGAGTLYVVATPIGNLSDLSTRGRETLSRVQHILAEDTRRARVLLSHIGVGARPISLHAHNEAGRVSLALRWLAAGDDVALVSDAGTPLLSDPGERLVEAVIDGGGRVVPIPGPSAVLAGLVASGLPCVPFTFVGFPPRRAGKRARALERIIDATETTVLFESPARLAGLLDELAALTSAGEPGRRVAVCREMTKVHEKVFRGTPVEAARHFRERPVRGEVTVVVEGRTAPGREATAAELEALATEALDAGLAPTAAARRVSAGSGLTRGEAYAVVQRVKDGRRASKGRGE